MSEGAMQPSEPDLLDESPAADTTRHSPTASANRKRGTLRLSSFNPKQQLTTPSFDELDSNQPIAEEGDKEGDSARNFSIHKLLDAKEEENSNTGKTEEKIINIYGALEPFDNSEGDIETTKKSFDNYSTQCNITSSKSTIQQIEAKQQGIRKEYETQILTEQLKLSPTNAAPSLARTNFQQVMDIYKPLEPFVEEEATPAIVSGYNGAKPQNQTSNYYSPEPKNDDGDASNEGIKQLATGSPVTSFDSPIEIYKPLEPFEDSESLDSKTFNYYSLPCEKDNVKKVGDNCDSLDLFEGSNTESTRDVEANYTSSIQRRPYHRSKSLPEEPEDGDIHQPGAFYVCSRAEGERPSWTQEAHEVDEPPMARRNTVPLPSHPIVQHGAASSSMPPGLHVQEEESESRREAPQILQSPSSRQRNNSMNPKTTEIETSPSIAKKKGMKAWIVVVAFILIIGVAIGLSIGLRGSNDFDEKNSSSGEDKCPHIKAAEVSSGWKNCLCEDSFTTMPKAYETQYNLLQVGLKDHLTPAMQNISSCELNNIALLWLAEDMVENNIQYDDRTMVSRFALASCFLSWYNYKKPWTTMEGWMSDANVCDWYGITCNENNEVITISLENNNLLGSIPTQLALLDHLSRFELDENGITGTIPTEIGRLRNLTRIFVENNQISGSIPSEIGQLSRLKFIDIPFNQLTGKIPSEVGYLISLERIELFNNQGIKGTIPSTIGSCVSLTKINFGSSQFSGTIPSEIGQLTNLQKFTSSYSQLTGSIPSTFVHLSELEILDLQSNKLSGTIPSTIGLNNTRMERITLRNNILSGSIPTEIGLLSSLEIVEFSSNDLEGFIPSQLGLCTDLAVIEIHNNFKIEGSIPSELGTLSQLATFSFHFTMLEGTVPLEICELTSITIMRGSCGRGSKISCDCCTECV